MIDGGVLTWLAAKNHLKMLLNLHLKEGQLFSNR